MTPTEILRQEHEAILIALKILEQICEKLESEKAVNPKHVDEILEFISVFADQCHHGKEETLLFPAMEKAGIPREGGPICVMLMEHEMGRNYIKGMREAWKNYQCGNKKAASTFGCHAAEYISLLTNHIDKENQCLFPMAEGRLASEVQKKLVEEFELMEIVKIGRGRHEAFHQMLHSLEKIYLTPDKVSIANCHQISPVD